MHVGKPSMRDTPVTSIEIPQSTLVVPKDRDINISRVLRHKDSRIISWCIISWCADVLLHPCHHLRDLLHINQLLGNDSPAAIVYTR